MAATLNEILASINSNPIYTKANDTFVVTDVSAIYNNAMKFEFCVHGIYATAMIKFETWTEYEEDRTWTGIHLNKVDYECSNPELGKYLKDELSVMGMSYLLNLVSKIERAY